MKTQEQLDRDVIEAAEAYATEYAGEFSTLYAWGQDLIRAVRARREAMRPTKPQVLREIAFRLVDIQGRLASDTEPWRHIGTIYQDQWRDALAELLAAPDEPEPPSRA